MNHLPPPISDATGVGEKKVYHAGTLVYSKRTLAVLFVWLFWGDACYVVMEMVMPSIMPLKFKALGASNTTIAVALTTLPWMINFFLNPIISVKSDRFRSRWGRRIPFIALATPFIVMILIGLGFGDKIGYWMHHQLGLEHYSPNTVALGVLAVLIVLFAIFNSFLNSVFWYMFNDVVPEHLLARFMSWFRVVGAIPSMLYSFFVYQYALIHTEAIFLGAALIYLTGFTLMCWNIKEGQYPPPSKTIEGGSPFSAIKNYGKECHNHPIYWCQFLITLLGCISAGTGAFGVFKMTISLGLSLHQLGILGGCNTAMGLGLILVSGWLADRYHPIRLIVLATFLGTFISLPLGFIWLFWLPSPNIVFIFCLVTGLLISAPIAALNGVWDPPLLMRIFPRTHYGQFCSCNAMWRAAGSILGAASVGFCLDKLTPYVGEKRVYLYEPFWSLIFTIPILILVLMLYRHWKRCGGDSAYVAPLPQNTVPITPTASIVTL